MICHAAADLAESLDALLCELSAEHGLNLQVHDIPLVGLVFTNRIVNVLTVRHKQIYRLVIIEKTEQ